MNARTLQQADKRGLAALQLRVRRVWRAQVIHSQRRIVLRALRLVVGLARRHLGELCGGAPKVLPVSPIA